MLGTVIILRSDNPVTSGKAVNMNSENQTILLLFHATFDSQTSVILPWHRGRLALSLFLERF